MAELALESKFKFDRLISFQVRQGLLSSMLTLRLVNFTRVQLELLVAILLQSRVESQQYVTRLLLKQLLALGEHQLAFEELLLVLVLREYLRQL